jgi:hypothetical protein
MTELKTRANSNFHFVLNLNISHYDLSQRTRDERLELIKKTKEAFLYFKDNIHEFIKDGKKTHKITEWISGFEVGKERKFLHVDSFFRMNSYVQLNLPKVKSYFNKELENFTKGCHADVKYIHDNVKTVSQYAQKERIPMF